MFYIGANECRAVRNNGTVPGIKKPVRHPLARGSIAAEIQHLAKTGYIRSQFVKDGRALTKDGIGSVKGLVFGNVQADRV